MVIIGISGPPCSGKDTAAEYLTDKYNFYHISTGNLLRKQAELLGIGTDRPSLQALGARIRAKHDGQDPLLIEALSECKENTIFSGIRTIGAAALILGHTDGKLIYVESETQQRYQRSVIRKRDEILTYTDFIAQDEIEQNKKNELGISLMAVRGLASIIINNNGLLQEYYEELDNFILKNI